MFRKSFLRCLSIISLFILFLSSPVIAKDLCYSKMSEVLGCFLDYDDGEYQYSLIGEDNSNPKLTKKTYLLSSQKWPIKSYQDIPSTVWQHHLVVYIPKEMVHNKALLYVGGGRNYNIEGKKGWLLPKDNINFSRIALTNKAPVISLLMVPNQFLFFNGKPYKEDQLLAYTYKRFMEDPLNNAYLAGHLPMAKSIVKGMDAAQDLFLEKGIYVDGFVLSGASKRGWSVWLAALGDDRVKAIIPINIDILNVQESIAHTCKSHGSCPPALKDYEECNISKVIEDKDPAFAKLMAVEDPYSYLQDGYAKEYRKRLSIPKYIINSSGDDFFVPDSSRWYFKKLPGDNRLRYLPNALHYFAGNPISDATNSLRSINDSINSYLYFILNNKELPQVGWEFFENKVNVTSSMIPLSAKLWIAHNKKGRDFRFLTSYSKWHLLTKRILGCFTNKICDNCYKPREIIIPSDCKKDDCKLTVNLPAIKQGWQASFVELHYKIDGFDFVATTEVNVTSSNFSDQQSGNNFHNEL